MRPPSKIGQYDKDEKLLRVFSTVKEAMAFLGKTSNSRLYHALEDDTMAYGYYWRYVNEDKID